MSRKSGHLQSRFALLQDWLGRPIGSDSERVLWVVMFVLLVVMRQPRILLEGRFWAEEGPVFFVNAWDMPWYRALLLPYAGYLNLIANLAGVLARHFASLRAAPYVSTSLALLVQCTPAVLLVTSRADWLQHRIVIMAALTLVAIIPFSLEVSLSSIGSQFYLALAVGIILATEPRRGAAGALQALVLFVAPLSGPASWVLVPLFALRAALDRSRLRALQTALLAAGVILQMAFFYGSSTSVRYVGISPTLLGAVLLAKHILTPILYDPWNVGVIHSFANSFSEAGGPVWPLVIVIILYAILFTTALRTPYKGPLWLFCAGLTIALISYCGVLGQKLYLISGLSAGRYALAPQALFDLSILCWCVTQRGRMRFWSGCAVAWLIIISLLDYHLAQVGPAWPPQVKLWQQDKSYALQIWPPGTTMTLPH
jgi:hypothetical protein